MKLFIPPVVQFTIVLGITLNPTFGFVLNSEEWTKDAGLNGSPGNVCNLTQGYYWIQSGAYDNGSILIGALKDGVVDDGSGRIVTANISLEVSDLNGNPKAENALRWFVRPLKIDGTLETCAVDIKTYGPNRLNRMDWLNMGNMFPMEAKWMLFDMEKGHTVIRGISWNGDLLDECWSENGLQKDLELKPCNERDVKQMWNFVRVDDEDVRYQSIM